MTMRIDIASRILAGFASNPAVFASNDTTGWDMVNCTDEQLIAVCYRLADKLMGKPALHTHPHIEGALRYGSIDGVPVKLPDGYELVPEGEFVPMVHYRLIVDEKGHKIWQESRLASPLGEVRAQVYPHPGGNGRLIIAYVRPWVQP